MTKEQKTKNYSGHFEKKSGNVIIKKLTLEKQCTG